jgi:hypothetical protein
LTRFSVFIIGTSALGLAAASADAQTASRAWVSGKGTDAAGCGLVTSPCRTPQYAHDNIVAAGGEIDILDPAGYGSITITKAISIVNDGVGTAGIQAPTGDNAITINAGASDAVELRGLTIDGSAISPSVDPANGIVFNSGAGLIVTNCVVQNFGASGNPTGYGILIQPSSGTISFVISSTVVSNTHIGIDYSPLGGSPSANGIIDHVLATNNTDGIFIDTHVTSSGSTALTISNSIANNNGSVGIYVQNGSGSTLTVSIDNSSMSGNVVGIEANGPANVLLGRSIIMGNDGVGVYNSTSPNNTFYTYQDNRINLNTFDFFMGTSPLSPLTRQ